MSATSLNYPLTRPIKSVDNALIQQFPTHGAGASAGLQVIWYRVAVRHSENKCIQFHLNFSSFPFTFVIKTWSDNVSKQLVIQTLILKELSLKDFTCINMYIFLPFLLLLPAPGCSQDSDGTMTLHEAHPQLCPHVLHHTPIPAPPCFHCPSPVLLFFLAPAQTHSCFPLIHDWTL